MGHQVQIVRAAELNSQEVATIPRKQAKLREKALKMSRAGIFLARLAGTLGKEYSAHDPDEKSTLE